MTSNQKYLSDVFVGAFLSVKEAQDLAERIVVDKVRIFKDSSRIEIWVLPEPRLSEDERMLLMACIDVYLHGQLKIELKMTEDRSKTCSRLKAMTMQERKEQLLKKMKTEQPSAVPFLKEALFRFEGEDLTVLCSEKAMNFFRARKTEPLLARLFAEIGGEGTVSFEAVKEMDAKAVNAGEESQSAAPAPKPFIQEETPSVVKATEEKPYPEGDSAPWDAPLPSAPSEEAEDNGGFEPEEKPEEKKHRNQVMCGKPINTKDEISLSLCDVERRNVVTRGIVTSVSIREIQNAKGILNLKLTDYANTVMVKAFVVMKTYHERMENQLVKGRTVLVKGNLNMDSYAQDLVLTASSVTLCGEDMVIDEAKKAAVDAMVLGRPFEGERITIAEALKNNPYGKIILQGDILTTESKELRNERTLMSIDITDYTDSITVKAFFDNDELEKKGGMLKKGKQIRVLGHVQFEEKFSHEYQMTADSIAPSSNQLKPERKDTYPEGKKRVELHAHTKISEMDAVMAPKDLVNQAFRWGHKAVAITDHGVVQGFPEAMDAAKKNGIKVVYGCEAYVVDDTKKAVIGDKGQGFDDVYVVFDIETTGFNKEEDRILEIGAVKVESGKIVDRFSHFIDPERPIPEHITKLTSITDEDVKGQGTIDVILPQFKAWVGDAVLVAHNASFDTGFIANKNAALGYEAMDNTIVDTLELARGLYDLKRYTLDAVAKHLDISLENHHRAVDDAECTAGIFLKMLEDLKGKDIHALQDVNPYIHEHTDVKRLRSHHAIILVQNKVGLKHLYELVSLAHLTYFFRQPRIPKSEIESHREGLILGSACSAGEIYEAILENDSQEELDRLASFYDYLEIQPIANNLYLIDDEDHGNIRSVEDLQNINRRIIELGRRHNKMTVATSDAHFMNPEDEEFRRILLASKDFKDADRPEPLYLHTTDEMMEEFSYLGEELAEEVVITNPNKIADMVERILPIPDGQFPPVIEGAADELHDVCYAKAKSMYGDPLPEYVQERLDRELSCIIKYGFSTLYILARRLVLHSVADGYYVGSRGSVGSSFVATMAGITEVNPLKAHYYCKKCHYTDFDPPEARNVAGMSGFDLPHRKCPNCGEELVRDGQEIPFEVFLGFKGDKEPDIDLNFSGEYQAKAHAYVEEMFGVGHAFKAGTMGGLAEKTAYGMVKHYLEDRGRTASNAQINYLISGVLDVKRTTGQHPGGIIVVPQGYDVCDFTPVQHPANDMTTNIKTTHYDYDQLHGRLLKLDILGHDDPTMIRMLEDMTHTVATEVPIDDPGVMELFLSTDSLGVTPEQIGSPVGTYGISEFGTHFVRQMLVDTKPKNFSDLCRISGLSHGTDVWNNNAKDIVTQGIATISECICTREDIMIDLIHLGMDKSKSFQIMEKVRKGKKSGGLSPDDIADMVAHGIEPWYLESCKKIQYLFPKGHAVAYVTMSLRIAYYKVHYKEYYYAAYFTIRADSFDYEKMALGEAVARKAKEAIEAKSMDETTAKDKEIHTLLELVVEFYSRGCTFLPMDLKTSDSHKFQVIDGKLLPPFDTISGMGQTAAQSIVEARDQSEFLTITDFVERTKVSRTIADTMKQLGVFGDMPETDQMSLF